MHLKDDSDSFPSERENTVFVQLKMEDETLSAPQLFLYQWYYTIIDFTVELIEEEALGPIFLQLMILYLVEVDFHLTSFFSPISKFVPQQHGFHPCLTRLDSHIFTINNFVSISSWTSKSIFRPTLFATNDFLPHPHRFPSMPSIVSLNLALQCHSGLLH